MDLDNIKGVTIYFDTGMQLSMYATKNVANEIFNKKLNTFKYLSKDGLISSMTFEYKNVILINIEEDLPMRLHTFTLAALTEYGVADVRAYIK